MLGFRKDDLNMKPRCAPLWYKKLKDWVKKDSEQYYGPSKPLSQVIEYFHKVLGPNLSFHEYNCALNKYPHTDESYKSCKCSRKPAEFCKLCKSKNVLCIYYSIAQDLVDAVVIYELECLDCGKYTSFEYWKI